MEKVKECENYKDILKKKMNTFITFLCKQSMSLTHTNKKENN